jgi:hypothetical protein
MRRPFHSPRPRVALLAFLIGLLPTTAAAGAVAARPGEPLAVFEAWERVGRDWPTTLVTYTVSLPPGRARAERVRIVDMYGRTHPVQLSRVRRHRDGSLASARVSFQAMLPRGGHYRFLLIPGRPPRSPGAPTARTSRGFLLLDNGVTALRLRALGERAFSPPLRLVAGHDTALRRNGRMEAAGLAFGPIAGVRLADGRWVGGSYFSAFDPSRAPRVSGYTSRVTERGPLFVEAEVAFRFDTGGLYRLTVRLLAGDPIARFDEMVDLGQTAPPASPVEVVMSLGSPGRWRPDAAFLFAPQRETRAPALEAALRGQGLAPRNASVPISYGAWEEELAELAPHEPWGPWAHYLGLVDTHALGRSPAAPFLALVPMHAGTWRGTHAIRHRRPRVVAYGPGDVAIHWPLRAEPHPQNLLHTGEFDPEFGLSGLRRLWGLVAGPFQYHDSLAHARGSEGYVNLDDYKDWILEWSTDTRAARERPVTPKDLQEPGPLWFFDRAWVVAADRDRAWVAHYRQAEASDWTTRVRARLADPALQPEERGRLRSELAAIAHLLAEPDFNTRASMSHQGNPNMPINRFFALPFVASLIPDHPSFERWMTVSAAYARYQLAKNVAPGGAWSELLTYFPAAAPTLIHGALVAQDAGRLDRETRALATSLADFTLRLLTPPDPRFGIRLLPGFGHEGNVAFNHWLPAAALVRDRDPERAALLAWAWAEQGRPMGGQHDNGFSERTAPQGDLDDGARPEALRRALGSAWLPGFGAVLRANPGTPGETYLAYRQGYLVSHSDANQGDFALYARGAPLVAGSVFEYPIHQHEAFARLYREFGWHSRVRIGRPDDDGGWPGGGAQSGVHRHSWSEPVDYLRGVGDWRVGDGADAVVRRWTRQIMFVKATASDGPSYFVFRDAVHLPGEAETASGEAESGRASRSAPAASTARSGVPWWWFLRTPGSVARVTSEPGGFTHRSPWGPILEVRLLTPATVSIASRDATVRADLIGHVARAWVAAGSPTVDAPLGTVRVEDTLTVTAVGPIEHGQDVLAVLFPRRPDEAAPTYELLGDGAVRVTTPESTDYIFVSRTGMELRVGDVAFTGIAGAVRVTDRAVHLIVAEGPGTVTYRGVTLRADAPAARVVPFADVTDGRTIDAPASPPTVAFRLDPEAGPIAEVARGVWRQVRPEGVAWEFRAEARIEFAESGVLFAGRRGGLILDTRARTVRAVVVDGDRIGFGGLLADVASGPYEVTFHQDRVTGRSEGPARFLHLTLPAGLDRMPTVVVDGVPHAPGPGDRLAIVPLGEGAHTFSLEGLPQPPVFRSWRWW